MPVLFYHAKRLSDNTIVTLHYSQITTKKDDTTNTSNGESS